MMILSIPFSYNCPLGTFLEQRQPNRTSPIAKLRAQTNRCLSALLCIASLISLVSCKKFVAVNPPITQLASATVFQSDASATSAVNGIYSQMISSGTFSSGGSNGVSVLSGLSADELDDYTSSPQYNSFYTNSLTADNTVVRNALWAALYQYIYYTNAIVEGLKNSSGVSTAVHRQLDGEAKFIRGFCYFYLANLFGDVPLITTTDYKKNATALRQPVLSVYAQIISDLSDAKDLLAADYSFSGNERTRPNKYAASALLSRVHLFLGHWAEAEAEATTVINRTDLYALTSLDDVFLKNSSESIWQLMPVLPDYNTNDGELFILTTQPTFTALRTELVNSFESGDQRKVHWVGSYNDGSTTYYFPYKYKIKTSSSVDEYAMILRLAEVYLIRAEARTHLGNYTDAQADINVIRFRAGLAATAANTQTTLVLAIEQERKIELFSEWGHRWLDLKRTDRANTLLGPLKGNLWQSSDMLYPIPLIDIKNDPQLTQNPGY